MEYTNNLVKTCTKCGETKPATLEHFSKHAKCLYGVNSVCKECVKLQYQQNKEKKLEQAKEYYYKNKEKVKVTQKQYREENKEKLAEYRKEYYEENKEELNAKQKEYYLENREEILEYKKQYRENNREKVLEQGRKHYHAKGKYTRQKWVEQNREKVNQQALDYYYRNKDVCLERQRKYKMKNKEFIKRLNIEWREENRERDLQNKKEWYQKIKDNPQYKAKVKKYGSKWAKLNKDKLKIRYHKRSALKRRLPNDFTLEDWEDCLNFFDYKDAYTGLPMQIPSQDHVIPLSKNGHYTSDNIVPCEKAINSSKHDSDMEEWFRQQPFFSEQRLSKIYEWIYKNSNKGVIVCEK